MFVEKQHVRDLVRYGMLLRKETLRYDLSRQCDFTILHRTFKTLVRRVPYRTSFRYKGTMVLGST